MKPIQYAIIGGIEVYDSGVTSFQETVKREYGEIEVNITEIEGKFYCFPCSTWERTWNPAAPHQLPCKFESSARVWS